MARDARLLGCLAAAFAVCLVVAGSSSAATLGTYGPLIEHWDGNAWTRVPAAGAADDLSAVVAVSATDVWAFGTYNVKSAVAEHWDGSSWQQVPMPVPQGTDEVELAGAAARSATDVWVVGTWAGYSDADPADRTLIEHWDGTTWKVVPSPNPTRGATQLDGVAVLSPKNAWAVGWYKGPHALGTLVLHWNGTKWRRVRSPNPAASGIRPYDDLTAVAALSARNVWAVGTYLHGKSRRSYMTLVLHWNGKRWKRAPSANPGGVGHANELDAVAADPAGHLWAAGGYRNGSGSEQPLVERRRTRGWRGVPAQAAPVAAYESALESLAPLTATDVWAAGTYLDDTRDFAPVALVEHWDGHSWSIVPTWDPVDPMGYEVLHGIAAVSATDIWAVGEAGTIG